MECSKNKVEAAAAHILPEKKEECGENSIRLTSLGDLSLVMVIILAYMS